MKNFQNKAKIIKVSKIIRHILFAGLVLWIGIGIPTVLLQAVKLWNQIGNSATLYLQGGVAILLALSFVVNLKLFRFFDRLKNGYLFDAKTVGNLDAAGKWWIVLWLFEVLFYEIGHGVFQISDAWNSGGLFAGLTLIFVAWLLKEAQELQEEQELTV
ncbi:MAG TPA: hypothetical protein DCQ92_13600 [Verrucomicrobia subdivision 3 bacterium]|nr:hypothetical protein [Limisphaerales bacterium]